MATPPITIIKMASTFARTGRAMKKSEIMAPLLFAARGSGRRRSEGLELRIDFLTGDRPQDAGDDDAIVGLEPALDHAQVADPGTDCDLALLDRVVVVEHEQVAPALIGAESACFDATWRLASSACRSYSASVCFSVAWAPAWAARACSSLSLYDSSSYFSTPARVLENADEIRVSDGRHVSSIPAKTERIGTKLPESAHRVPEFLPERSPPVHRHRGGAA